MAFTSNPNPISTSPESRSRTEVYPLTGLHCQACVGRLTAALAPFADSVEVSLVPMQAVLLGANAPVVQLQTAVQAAGSYTLLPALPPSEKAPAAPSMAAAAPPDSPAGWAAYRPLALLLGYILLGSVLVQWGMQGSVNAMETMRYFMAGFFLCFSFFKLLDLHAFADAYASYDLLAARWHGWGYVYPFIELALGIAYLGNFAPVWTDVATVLVMGFSAIGVVKAVFSGQKIRCACLGTVFNLPMSTVTIVEDVGMVAMAAVMLAMR